MFFPTLSNKFCALLSSFITFVYFIFSLPKDAGFAVLEILLGLFAHALSGCACVCVSCLSLCAYEDVCVRTTKLI